MRDSPHNPNTPERRGRMSRLAGDALEHFHGKLHRYLARHLGGAQDVEDLSQEVYLRLLRAGGEKEVEHPQAYVYRVAFNVLYEFKFHRKHGVVTFDSEALAAVAEGLEDEAARPDVAYQQRHLGQQLAAAVAQLSPMQRAVFLLAKHQDLSHAEVAGRLGISINTARVHLHRAISHCRQALLRETGDTGRNEGEPA